VNQDEKDRIVARYNARLKQFGDDIRTLAAGTTQRRRVRFQVLREVGLVPGCTVMDVGCGFGDFFGYLLEQNLEVSYLGIDINTELIDIARRKYPRAEFRVADLQTDELPRVDFLVSSNAFNLRLQESDNYALVADILARSYRQASRGVAIDFLTTYVDFQSSADVFHYTPERLFGIAKRITKRVCVRHDYPLFEFCLYLYPDFEGWAPAA
jgi:ubiquinone/menaquinone biosynthesis C-methylase UbiE